MFCRDNDELTSHLSGIRQCVETKGWTLVTEPPTADALAGADEPLLEA